MPSSESRPTSVGASGSNREPTTPISMLGSQIPPHSAELEIENINLEHNEEDVKEQKVSRNRVKVVWSIDEEKCLARALSTTINDPKIGNAQKNRQFWRSITIYYNDNRPAGTPVREWTAIKPHYYQVMPDVGKFSGWYNNFFNNRTSGESDADILAATHDMWKKMHKNKAFKYEHVWKIMTECERWTIQSLGRHADKKTRTSELGAHTSSTNLDIDDDSEIHSHPIGQQRTKRNNKAKVIEDERVNVKWIQMQQYQKEKLASKEAEIKQKEIELKQAEIKQKEIELKQRDYDILMKDTSGMTETQFHWHMKIVEEIAERRDLK